MKKFSTIIISITSCYFYTASILSANPAKAKTLPPAITSQRVFSIKLPDRNSLDALRVVCADLDFNNPIWVGVSETVQGILSRGPETFDAALRHTCGSGGRSISHVHLPIRVARSGAFDKMEEFPDDWANAALGWILFGKGKDREADGVKGILDQAVKGYCLEERFEPSRQVGAPHWATARNRLQALAQRFWGYQNCLELAPGIPPSRQFSHCEVIKEGSSHFSGHPDSSPIYTLKSIKIRFDRIFQQRGRVATPIQEWHDFLTQIPLEEDAYSVVAADLSESVGRWNANWDYGKGKYLSYSFPEGYERSIISEMNHTNIVIVTLVIGINSSDARLIQTLRGINDASPAGAKAAAIGGLLSIRPNEWHVCSFYIR